MDIKMYFNIFLALKEIYKVIQTAQYWFNTAINALGCFAIMAILFRSTDMVLGGGECNRSS